MLYRYWANNVCEGRNRLWCIRHFNSITGESIKRQLLRGCCVWIFHYFFRTSKTKFNFLIIFCIYCAGKYMYSGIIYRNRRPASKIFLDTQQSCSYIVKLYSAIHYHESKPRCSWVISNQEDWKNNQSKFQSPPHVPDDMKKTALDGKWLLGIQRR